MFDRAVYIGQPGEAVCQSRRLRDRRNLRLLLQGSLRPAQMLGAACTCRSELARECGVSANIDVTDPTPSRPS